MSSLNSLPRNFSGLCCGVVLVLSAQLLATPIGAMAPAHRPSATKTAKEQIQLLEERWRTATIKADVPMMDKLLAEDYVGISWTGQVNTKATQLDRLRNRTVPILGMTLSDTKIKVVGAVAIVTSRATYVVNPDDSGLNGDFLYTRIYQLRPSGVWQITNSEATRVPSGERKRRREQTPAATPPVDTPKPPQL